MATIVLNESAPADLNGVSLANAELDAFPYETTDPEVIANATAHPWLDVEVEEQPELAYASEAALDPKEDPLSAQNERALSVNDPDAVREVEEGKARTTASVAVESGLDQNESEFVGKTAVTTAASDVQEPVVEAPAPVKPEEQSSFNFNGGENS